MECRKLGDFVSLRQGLAINSSTSHLVSENKNEEFIYPLLRIADLLENKYSKYISKEVNQNVLANKEDIIYTRTGQIGLAFRGHRGVVHNNNFVVTIINDELDQEYLYTILQSDFVRNQALNLAKNSVQPDLTHEMFKSIRIPFPNKEEQKKIARLYLTISNKIKNNNKIIEELEKLSKTIYDYWFLQFDFPDKNGNPYKASKGKMVWNNILKRKIPEGWKVQNLKENKLTQILNPGIDNFEGNKIYLATGDVENNSILSGTNITYKNRESRANMQPIENSVWFAKMKNSTKHIFVGEYSKKLIENHVFSTGFLGLKCLNKKYMEYINCFINSDFFEIQKDKLAHGATQEAVNNNDISLIPLLIPDNIILEKFHKTTNSIFEEIYTKNQENEELKKLRNFLLPLLMNGQIKL